MGLDKQAVTSLRSIQDTQGSTVALVGLAMGSHGEPWGAMGGFRAGQLHESVGFRSISGSRREDGGWWGEELWDQ